jgi:hypothetical protein
MRDTSCQTIFEKKAFLRKVFFQVNVSYNNIQL